MSKKADSATNPNPLPKEHPVITPKGPKGAPAGVPPNTPKPEPKKGEE